MEDSTDTELARLLEAVADGDRDALRRLVALVYDELRALAHRQRRRWNGDHTLDTTALVHEAFLKLVDQAQSGWSNRAHFLAAASRAMRHILINYSRDRRALKRGGGEPLRCSLTALDAVECGTAAQDDADLELLIALDEALSEFGRDNPRQSQIVECRFFGGMTIEETAAALGISTASVSRGWLLAQARLYEAMQGDQRAARDQHALDGA